MFHHHIMWSLLFHTAFAVASKLNFESFVKKPFSNTLLRPSATSILFAVTVQDSSGVALFSVCILFQFWFYRVQRRWSIFNMVPGASMYLRCGVDNITWFTTEGAVSYRNVGKIHFSAINFICVIFSLKNKWG